MKMMLGLLLSVLLTAAAQGSELATQAKEVIGAWKLDFTTPDGVHRTPLVIVGRQRDELSAWYDENDNIQEFNEVKLSDDSIRLTIVPKDHQGDITVTLKARPDGDGKCRGEAEYTSKSGAKGEWKFTGRRLNPSDFDESSQWTLSFAGPDQQPQEATVTVVAKDGKHYGWLSSSDYELPAQELTVNGDQVKMKMKAKTPHGSDVEVTFDGKVDGDEIKGNATYSLDSDRGTFSFTAKRKS